MTTADGHARTVRMLGTQGIPARYGGFETAAERLALYLRDQGWNVVVYCQELGSGPSRTSEWNGIELVTFPVPYEGWRGSAVFDFRSVRHACRFQDLCLTFGYNTAALGMNQWFRAIPNVINMDGMEWSRERWGPALRAVLYANEWIAAQLGDHLIADHPEIARHLKTRTAARRISTIPYGADKVEEADVSELDALGLDPHAYVTLICRPISENSILELVQGFSARRRGAKLVVLGRYVESDPYHRAVKAVASDEVMFVGSHYGRERLASLRYYSLAYAHGHKVGGTNPSLVEALGAGNAVVAHDNPFNRWVAGAGAVYFTDADSAAAAFDLVLTDNEARRALQDAARVRHASDFTWPEICERYESILMQHSHPEHFSRIRTGLASLLR